jgi:hypothetical protein
MMGVTDIVGSPNIPLPTALIQDISADDTSRDMEFSAAIGSGQAVAHTTGSA